MSGRALIGRLLQMVFESLETTHLTTVWTTQQTEHVSQSVCSSHSSILCSAEVWRNVTGQSWTTAIDFGFFGSAIIPTGRDLPLAKRQDEDGARRPETPIVNGSC